MAEPINYNGFNIAPEMLNPELQSQLQSLGLSPEDYTESQIQAREMMRNEAANTAAAQDLLSQAQQEVQRPEGFLGLPAGGTATISQQGPEYTGAILREARGIQKTEDEALVAAQREEQRKQAELREQMRQAQALGLDPRALGLSMETVQKEARPMMERPSVQMLASQAQQAFEPQEQPLPEPSKPQQQMQAANLITAPERAMPVQRPSEDPFRQAMQDFGTLNTELRQSLEQSRQREQEAVQKIQTNIDNLQQKLNTKQIKNPWDSKNFAQKVLSAVAIGLGGIGAGLGGGRNTALDIINQDIQNEYDRQENEIKNVQGNLEQANNILAQTRQAFSNERAAQLQTFGVLRNLAADKFDLLQARLQYPQAKEKAALEAELLRSQARKNFADASRLELENVGVAQQLMTGRPAQLNEADKVRDKEFAKTINEYFDQGKIFDLDTQVDQLTDAIDSLKTSNITGGVIGRLPDAVVQLFNENAISVRETIEQVVQRDLRRILGAQFTEREGERLISRAFNPRLSEEENIKRVGRILTQIDNVRNSLRDKKAYYEQFGTLKGYQGPDYSNIRTAEDFWNADLTGRGQQDDLAASRAYYQNVLNNPGATPTQKAEARLALEEIVKLGSF